MKHIYLSNHLYFVTSVTHERQKFFLDEQNCRILIDNLKFYRNKLGFKLIAYVIMPDHFHAIIQVPENLNISTIMHDIKRFSSIQINKSSKRIGEPVWQEGFFEHIIRDEKDFRVRLDYIHKNPLTAGLVEVIDEYRFSSYRNYYMQDDSNLMVDKILT